MDGLANLMLEPKTRVLRILFKDIDHIWCVLISRATSRENVGAEPIYKVFAKAVH